MTEPNSLNGEIKYSPERIRGACAGSKGRMYQVAWNLGVSISALSAYLTRNPDLKQIYIEAMRAELDRQKVVEEERLDKAEAKLDELVQDGDVQAVKFYLDRKGRSRGYGEKVINEHTVSGNVEILFGVDMKRFSPNTHVDQTIIDVTPTPAELEDKQNE